MAGLDYQELVEICTREGVPVDLIYSIEDIFEDEHYAAREDIVEVPDDTFGTMKMPAVHPVLSSTPGKIEWRGPSLGLTTTRFTGGFWGWTNRPWARLRRRILYR